MSDTPLDRPATLKRQPRPAPDDDVDPVDTRPAERDPRPASTPPATPSADAEPAAASNPPASGDAPTLARPTAAARPAPPFPFSTRIAPDVRDILDAVKALGYTERAAVEKAVREYWGRRVQPPR